ncbi:MAG: molybdopterin molybdotransferase MoeA, partial [Terriglobia bacterium]
MIPSYEQALTTVKDKLTAATPRLAIESALLDQALGRVLAVDLRADRDYPPFHRSARDGYAVRSQDVSETPVELECTGEIAAGGHFEGEIAAGQCAAIMTGAPLPEGADAVVMIEQTAARNSRVEFRQAVQPFANVVRKGSESPAGRIVLRRGSKLGASEIGALAANGIAEAEVFRKPRVAILATGSELVPVAASPQWFQIRDSNAAALAAQVANGYGEPWRIGIAPDLEEPLRTLIEQSLSADLLLISGGVSVGKYDLVERILE